MANPNSIPEFIPLILVVDDDRAMRNLLTVAMEEEGYKVVVAKDGEQCLAEYKRNHPHIILLDAMMPEMDGFTCCERLRALPQGKDLPILMITTLDDQNSIDQAFAVGATDYITKPIYWAVLSQRVKRMLQTHQGLIQLKPLQQKLELYQQWQPFWQKILSDLSGSIDLETWLHNTIGEARHIAKVDRLLLYQFKGKIWSESVASDYPSLQKLSLAHIGMEKIYGDKYKAGEIIALADLTSTELTEEAIASLKNKETAAVLMIPVFIEAKPWGLLCIHQCHAPYPWKTEEKEQFSHLAQLLAIAIYTKSQN